MRRFFVALALIAAVASTASARDTLTREQFQDLITPGMPFTPRAEAWPSDGRPLDLGQFMRPEAPQAEPLRPPGYIPEERHYRFEQRSSAPATKWTGAPEIVVDTRHKRLFYFSRDFVKMYRVGVGREGFLWSGESVIEEKRKWPGWTPPAQMIERQPYLPRYMAGGPGNPLGARALYIAGTLYRIHGTNDPRSIGKNMSSGCIRMMNADVRELYDHVAIGTKVTVLK